MNAHPDAGAMGVRMIDGSGRFLKESKRGFPSPWVSFCKMSGLTALFPSSRLFARYYLGHLQEDRSHVVDVLSGAFLMAGRELLNKLGGFDEQFFMYAEDIDLSYRIQQAGYKNYYEAESTIIHFKGESTRKDAKYVRLFYTAMIQFVRKHYRGFKSGIYIALLKMMIWLRGGDSKPTTTDSRPERGNHVTERGKFLMTGDDSSIEAVKEFIRGKIVVNSSEAKSIIFCEGPSFSFKNIIIRLQQLLTGQKAFIHGKATNSIIGSSSKNIHGEVIRLK
jgi:cellulose synthase/poly-beta-1,6-N-acetylglucosamine synthase-like glycosyltransferase